MELPKDLACLSCCLVRQEFDPTFSLTCLVIGVHDWLRKVGLVKIRVLSFCLFGVKTLLQVWNEKLRLSRGFWSTGCWAIIWSIIVDGSVLQARYLGQLDWGAKLHCCVVGQRARVAAKSLSSKCCLASERLQWVSLVSEVVAFFADLSELSSIFTEPPNYSLDVVFARI